MQQVKTTQYLNIQFKKIVMYNLSVTQHYGTKRQHFVQIQIRLKSLIDKHLNLKLKII